MSTTIAASSPVDRKTAWKIVLAVVVVVGAISSLLWSSMQKEIELWKSPDEILANPTAWKGKRLNVGGRVVEASIVKSTTSLDHKFKIESRPPAKPAVMDVDFSGIPPDTFKSGGEVVATGTIGADGVFKADTIMAKCPSKYEAKPRTGNAGFPTSVAR